MFTTALTIVISLVLLAYWFRYACTLMLSAHPCKDLTGKISEANKLKFHAVHSQLNTNPRIGGSELDTLFHMLNSDHRILRYLMKHGACYREACDCVEHFLLELDYRLMAVVYRLSRSNSSGVARSALREMAGVLHYFASSMGANMGADSLQVQLPQ